MAFMRGSNDRWYDADVADGHRPTRRRRPTAPSCLHRRAAVHAFDVLGDPVRRRILELLADGELASGGVVEVIREEFGMSQPAVSQHLRVLREHGFAAVRPDGARRLYSLDPTPLPRGGRLARSLPGPSGANASMPSARRSPEASARDRLADGRRRRPAVERARWVRSTACAEPSGRTRASRWSTGSRSPWRRAGCASRWRPAASAGPTSTTWHGHLRRPLGTSPGHELAGTVLDGPAGLADVRCAVSPTSPAALASTA